MSVPAVLRYTQEHERVSIEYRIRPKLTQSHRGQFSMPCEHSYHREAAGRNRFDTGPLRQG